MKTIVNKSYNKIMTGNFQMHFHSVALHPLFRIELEFGSVGFRGGRKTGEKPSEQGQEPTTNSTHV